MSEPEGLDEYIECALWSSVAMPPGADEDDQPIELDSWEGDLAPGVREALAADLDSFFCDHEVQTLIEQLGIPAQQAAHDFWLTRNHHGVGFWDRGYGAAGQRLTELADAYGGQDLYIGDDGLIWAAGLEPPRQANELHREYQDWVAHRNRLSEMEGDGDYTRRPATGMVRTIPASS